MNFVKVCELLDEAKHIGVKLCPMYFYPVKGIFILSFSECLEQKELAATIHSSSFTIFNRHEFKACALGNGLFCA